MTKRSPVARARENLTGIVAVLVTATWLAALLTGQHWWLPFMLVGYVAIVPIVAVLFGDEEDREEWWRESDAETGRADQAADPDRTDALQTIRDCYARGDLTEAQFERKLENLLETETLEDVKSRDSILVDDGQSPATDRSGGEDPETELEGEP